MLRDSPLIREVFGEEIREVRPSDLTALVDLHVTTWKQTYPPGE